MKKQGRGTEVKTVIQNEKKVNRYFIFLLLLLFCVFQYGVSKICGFTIFPDEFGYWASASRRVGYDWTEVAGMGSYYSYGYSLILTLVLFIFKDSIAAYRAAVFVNMLLMCVSLFLLADILEKIFPKEEADSSSRKVFFAGIAVFYPGWLFYMQMTLTEALLMFLFVLITWLLLCLLREKRLLFAAALAVILIYMYTVHMRTVGILIACTLTLLLWAVNDREGRKPVAFFLVVLLMAASAAMLWKKDTVSTVFAAADANVLAGNDYGNQWGKFKEILTYRGMKRLFSECIGKVYYLGLASFGIFYWAIGRCIRRCAQGIKEARSIKQQGIVSEIQSRVFLQGYAAVFLLLSTAGEILISTIFMYHGDNIDSLVYGRYTEFILPVLIAVGIHVMAESRFLFRITLLLGTASGMMTSMLLNMIEKDGRGGMRGYMAVGISYALKEKDFQVYQYFKEVWLLGFGLMLLTALLLYLGRKRKMLWLLGGILALEILLGLQAGHHYTYRVNSANFSDRRMAETIEELTEKNAKIVYLDEGAPAFIDFLQMQLRDKKIEVVKTEDKDAETKHSEVKNTEAKNLQENSFQKWQTEVEKADFVITCIDTQYDEQLQARFDRKMQTNSFLLFYNTENRKKQEGNAG